MCGIIGVASVARVVETEWLVAGRDTMKHRGPDDSGSWWSDDGRVGLGHRRLSIIDLSENGKQPMIDEKGILSIVFNGEIYNYKELQALLKDKGVLFKSDSDTEVILAAYLVWGVECLSYLNGMFAFAIFDRRNQQLFIARDRAGEKPLFYYWNEKEIRFSSELKGLLVNSKFQPFISKVSLNYFLSEGFVAGENTILQGIKKLPPASALLYDINNGTLKKWKYWNIPRTTEVQVNEEDLLFELESLLEDSVKRQLIADVPVGVLLSGGVDSSLITALAARVKPKVNTFTIKFSGHSKYDESGYARFIANHFGTTHYELNAEANSIDLLPQLARQFDEPIIDSSMIPTFLVTKMIRQHCTVAIGGDGGDELFGGYQHYKRLLTLNNRIKNIPKSVRKPVVDILERILPVGFKGRNWLQAAGVDLNLSVPLVASYFDYTNRLNLLQGAALPVEDDGRYSPQNLLGMDLIQRATRVDFLNYMPEDILVKVDRASMLNSLEVRAPMLDYRLIEFAFGKVPTKLKTTRESRKILLQKLTSKLLPAGFDSSRKQGFSIPLSDWLHSKVWIDYFKEILLDDSQTLFDHKMITSLFRNQQKGYSNGERLFGLVIFELWRKSYHIGSDLK
jgi:asparagine synthase (glutamine-hydrolysing)